MPKLSNSSLEKRFACHYCTKSFRTRQGLAGHIQFKHGTGQKSQEIDADFILNKAVNLQIWQATSNLPKSTMQAMINLPLNWHQVKRFCKVLGIQLNQNDFKTYMIASLGQLFQKGT